jgi:2-methylcitrate dehydratase PrpD
VKGTQRKLASLPSETRLEKRNIMGVTEKLAKFIAETPADAIPAAAMASAKLRFLDTLGVAVGGSRHASAKIAQDTARLLGGNPQATLVGHADRTSVELAGFINGVAAHALEYDDYTRMVTHLSASLVPGALAVGEYAGLSGQRVLEGFVIGFQVATQISKGLGAQLFDRGWHSPCLLGAFGVTAASCRLLNLDVTQTRMALGITASEASGIRKNVGSMGKAFHVGHGVRCGIFSALLASRGFTVDPDAIEGVDDGIAGHVRFGLAETFNGAGNYSLDKMEQGLGEAWELANNTTVVRMHPGHTAASSAIDAMIDLVREHNLLPDQVERIALECTTQSMKLGSYRTAEDGHKARFCLPYSMAVALIDRKAGLDQYTDQRVRSPDVQALMRRVDVSVPPDLKHHHGAWTGGVNWGEMRLKVHLRNGSQVSAARSSARGWPEHPATWSDISDKFQECCTGILDAVHIKTSIERIGELDQSASVQPLVESLCGRD